MKKIILVLLSGIVLISGCIEIGSSTTINADGSGVMLSTLDLGEMIRMAMSKSKKNDEGPMDIDTTVNFNYFSDTASSLSPRQKELIRDMKLNIKLDSESDIFRISVISPFKSLENLQELSQLMRENAYDEIFDKALDIPQLSDGEEKTSSRENDNIFASLFPDFFDCNFKTGKIECKINKTKFAATQTEMEKMDFDLDGEVAAKMFAEAKYTNRIILPSKAKKLVGDTMKQGISEKEYVQTGNLLDLYKYPEKYEYTIEY